MPINYKIMEVQLPSRSRLPLKHLVTAFHFCLLNHMEYLLRISELLEEDIHDERTAEERKKSRKLIWEKVDAGALVGKSGFR